MGSAKVGNPYPQQSLYVMGQTERDLCRRKQAAHRPKHWRCALPRFCALALSRRRPQERVTGSVIAGVRKPAQQRNWTRMGCTADPRQSKVFSAVWTFIAIMPQER